MTGHHPVELTRDEQAFLVKSLRHLSADDMSTVIAIIRQATHAEDATNAQDDDAVLHLNVLDLDPPVQRELLNFVLQTSSYMTHDTNPTQVARESQSSLKDENQELSHREWPSPRA
mmetsp:Transcript_10520/g.21430  ORF Transcript_10520/g.21430 Transcript_10520/m.21430 type:complete len:116 (+) Transcript_10520:301-648(+)